MATILPNTGGDPDLLEFDAKVQPSHDYKLDIERDRMRGTVENQEAVLQAVYFILNTERYAYVIYSWNYGAELLDLIGQPIDYAMSEVKRRITEALLADDRIESVDGFDFVQTKNTLTVTFTVHTVFGDINAIKEVQV